MQSSVCVSYPQALYSDASTTERPCAKALQISQTTELLTMNFHTACLKRLSELFPYERPKHERQRTPEVHTCMSLAERRCRRLASCWRTTSGSAVLQVTPALLVAPLLRVLELW